MRVQVGGVRGLLGTLSFDAAQGKLDSIDVSRTTGDVQKLCPLGTHQLVYVTSEGILETRGATDSLKLEHKNCVGIDKCQEGIILGFEPNQFQVRLPREDFKVSHEFSIPGVGEKQVLRAFRVGSGTSFMAVGGIEYDLRVYDLEKQQVSFRSKNVALDYLDLRTPLQIISLDYVDKDATKIITGTLNHKVRLYDSKSGNKRPVMDIELGDYAVNCIQSSSDQMFVAAGDSGGNVHKLDLRKNLKSIGKFQGNAGSIRGISIHESAPYLAAVGLDRYVRIFDTNSRKLVASSYLKQPLCSVTFLDDLDEKESDHEDLEQEEIQDADLLWDEIDRLEQKRKILEDSEHHAINKRIRV